MPESQKDCWDKFEIFNKFLGSVVLVLIATVIKFGADSISQSMERAKLIQSLTTQLAEGKAKRDIALTALNAAIPKKEKCTIFWLWGCKNDLDPETLRKDQVLGIAEILANRVIKDAETQGDYSNLDELEVAREIITNRANKEYYDTNFKADIDRLKLLAISSQNLDSTPEEKAKKAKISEVIAVIKPPPEKPTDSTDSKLKGIRFVYIQYKSNKKKAEEVQKAIQEDNKNISVPEVDQVDGITKNDIRYANAADKEIAQNLQKFLQDKKGIQITDENLKDLSAYGYKVPSGQIEIWLKD